MNKIHDLNAPLTMEFFKLPVTDASQGFLYRFTGPIPTAWCLGRMSPPFMLLHGSRCWEVFGLEHWEEMLDALSNIELASQLTRQAVQLRECDVKPKAIELGDVKGLALRAAHNFIETQTQVFSRGEMGKATELLANLLVGFAKSLEEEKLPRPGDSPSIHSPADMIHVTNGTRSGWVTVDTWDQIRWHQESKKLPGSAIHEFNLWNQPVIGSDYMRCYAFDGSAPIANPWHLAK